MKIMNKEVGDINMNTDEGEGAAPSLDESWKTWKNKVYSKDETYTTWSKI